MSSQTTQNEFIHHPRLQLHAADSPVCPVQSTLCSIPYCRPPASGFRCDTFLPTPSHSSFLLSQHPVAQAWEPSKTPQPPPWSQSPSDINATFYLRDSRLSDPSLHSHNSNLDCTCAWPTIRSDSLPFPLAGNPSFLSVHPISSCLSFKLQLRYHTFLSPFGNPLLSLRLVTHSVGFSTTSALPVFPHVSPHAISLLGRRYYFFHL